MPGPTNDPSPKRGEGRGGKFFVLDRQIWERLLQVPTANRLNLTTAFLVLLAGTGADHRLTKWSAKACEARAGMGKPRAKIAIEELIACGLAERTATSRRPFPHYRLAEPQSPLEPIFLPMQLVSGLAGEVPVLRRVRETGDFGVLQMLIDLYGLVQTDATYGIPLKYLRRIDPTHEARRKVTEIGANTVWALNLGKTRGASGAWSRAHSRGKKTGTNDEDWSLLWERVNVLLTIGALWFDPWVFGSDALDAEPLFPVRASADQPMPGEIATLSATIEEVAEMLVGDRRHLLDQNSDRVLVTLPTHHQPPALRGVARLRVEPDSPGRRLSYARRMEIVERQTAAYSELLVETQAGRFDRPLRLA